MRCALLLTPTPLSKQHVRSTTLIALFTPPSLVCGSHPLSLPPQEHQLHTTLQTKHENLTAQHATATAQLEHSAAALPTLQQELQAANRELFVANMTLQHNSKDLEAHQQTKDDLRYASEQVRPFDSHTFHTDMCASERPSRAARPGVLFTPCLWLPVEWLTHPLSQLQETSLTLKQTQASYTTFKTETSAKIASANSSAKKLNNLEITVRELSDIKEAHDSLLTELDDAKAQKHDLKLAADKYHNLLETSDDTLASLSDTLSSLTASLPQTPHDQQQPAANLLSPLRPRTPSTAPLTAAAPPPPPPLLSPSHLHLHTPRDPAAKQIWDAAILPLTHSYLTLLESHASLQAAHDDELKSQQVAAKNTQALNEKIQAGRDHLAMSKMSCEEQTAKADNLARSLEGTEKTINQLTSLTNKTFKNLRKADDINDPKTKHDMLVSIKVGMNKIESLLKRKSHSHESSDDEASAPNPHAISPIIDCTLRFFEHDLKLNDMYCDTLTTCAALKTNLDELNSSSVEEKSSMLTQIDDQARQIKSLAGENSDLLEAAQTYHDERSNAALYIYEVVESVKETIKFETQKLRRRTMSSASSSSGGKVSLRSSIAALETSIDEALNSYRELSAAHAGLTAQTNEQGEPAHMHMWQHRRAMRTYERTVLHALRTLCSMPSRK